VTFSDPAVREILNREFICAWANSNPELPSSNFGIIPPEGMEWRRNFPQGTGNTNVTLFFCTSDGRVLHHMEGCWGPTAFVREAGYVLAARDRLTVGGREVPENTAREGIREMHRQAIADYRDEMSWGGREPWDWPRPEPRSPVRPPPDEDRRRRPVPSVNGVLDPLIRFHESEIANPLRRVEEALRLRLPVVQTGG
jgi:hypothetical protein